MPPRDGTRGTHLRLLRGPSLPGDPEMRGEEMLIGVRITADPVAVREAVTGDDTLVSAPAGLRPSTHIHGHVGVQPASGTRPQPPA